MEKVVANFICNNFVGAILVPQTPIFCRKSQKTTKKVTARELVRGVQSAPPGALCTPRPRAPWQAARYSVCTSTGASFWPPLKWRVFGPKKKKIIANIFLCSRKRNILPPEIEITHRNLDFLHRPVSEREGADWIRPGSQFKT